MITIGKMPHDWDFFGKDKLTEAGRGVYRLLISNSIPKWVKWLDNGDLVANPNDIPDDFDAAEFNDRVNSIVNGAFFEMCRFHPEMEYWENW